MEGSRFCLFPYHFDMQRMSRTIILWLLDFCRPSHELILRHPAPRLDGVGIHKPWPKHICRRKVAHVWTQGPTAARGTVLLRVPSAQGPLRSRTTMPAMPGSRAHLQLYACQKECITRSLTNSGRFPCEQTDRSVDKHVVL